MFMEMVQMRPVIPTPNCPTENGEKLPKMAKKSQNYAKMAKKQPKMAKNCLKWAKNGPKNGQIYFFHKRHLSPIKNLS